MVLRFDLFSTYDYAFREKSSIGLHTVYITDFIVYVNQVNHKLKLIEAQNNKVNINFNCIIGRKNREIGK